jgi:hypothetical protein
MIPYLEVIWIGLCYLDDVDGHFRSCKHLSGNFLDDGEIFQVGLQTGSHVFDIDVQRSREVFEDAGLKLGFFGVDIIEFQFPQLGNDRLKVIRWDGDIGLKFD